MYSNSGSGSTTNFRIHNDNYYFKPEGSIWGRQSNKLPKTGLQEIGQAWAAYWELQVGVWTATEKSGKLQISTDNQPKLTQLMMMLMPQHKHEWKLKNKCHGQFYKV